MAKVVRSRGVRVGAALLLVSFVLELARGAGLLPAGLVDVVTIYISMTLPPTALLVFIGAGLFAPPKPFLAGALLGALNALLIAAIVLLNREDLSRDGAGAVEPGGFVGLALLAVGVGIVVTGVTGWLMAKMVYEGRKHPDG